MDRYRQLFCLLVAVLCLITTPCIAQTVDDDADNGDQLQSLRHRSAQLPAEGMRGADLLNDTFYQTFRPGVYRDDLILRTWSSHDLDAKRVTPLEERQGKLIGRVHRPPLLTLDRSYVLLQPAGQGVTLWLPQTAIGLYSFYFYGAIEPAGREKLNRIWRPCPLKFELLDGQGNVISTSQLLAKQSLEPRLLQGYQLHVDKPGDYALRISVGEKGLESLRMMRVVMIDALANLPAEPVKRSQNLEQTQATMKKLESLDEARLARDKAIWESLPPINTHLQVHKQVAQFLKPPADIAPALNAWKLKAYVGVRHPVRQPFAPYDLVNTITGEIFPHEAVLRGQATPGDFGDDGTGIFLSKEKYPELPHDIYYAPRAMMFGHRVRNLQSILGVGDGRSHSYAQRYFDGGNPNMGHDAAMALVRMAYDAPALHMIFHEHRNSTHSPDLEYNTDWSTSRRGKYFYSGWAGSNQVQLMTAYDQLFPYIQGNQVFADAVNRFIPWVKTPDDVVAFLDRYLVFSGVRDFRRGIIRTNSVEDVAAAVLGPHKLTESFFDLTIQQSQIYPYSGTFQELYATALSRSGSYHTGSFMVYALGSARSLVRKASLMTDAKKQGIELTMDLSDVERYTKVRGASDFMLDMWVAGGFPFMVGDASGGPHHGPEAIQKLKANVPDIRHAFELTGDPRHAYLLHHYFGDNDDKVIQAAQGQRDPIIHAPSRVVADYGAILEMGTDETDLSRKSAVTMRLGVGQGHAHSDHLDLNLFGLGLPMAVDLACRSEGNFWSRPPASWSYLHNHAIAHEMENPRNAGNQSGEPWLRSFSPQLMRGSYQSKTRTQTIPATDTEPLTRQRFQDELHRDVLLMQVGDSSAAYVFDVQRLIGSTTHTWCFHGCESDDIQINVPMQENTVVWNARMLEGTHKTGVANDNLQAIWTMTRQDRDVPYTFNRGGVIKTVAAEQAVLKDRYDESLPPARIRATLLGRGGDQVIQGSPYSNVYRYAFPFLWVQRTGVDSGSTVYPALYEWYRGDQPLIAQATIISNHPLEVKVTTHSGQVDRYIMSPDHTGLTAISRDSQGVRFIKMSSAQALLDGDVQLRPAHAGYEASIISIDYLKRRLELSHDLPHDAGVLAGNDLRKTYVPLKGSGRSFTYPDDLLVHEGRVTELQVIDDETIKIQTNQPLFQQDRANRHPDGFTQVTEDFSWAFRAGKAVSRPKETPLTDKVFTDANNDGFVNIKTYEIGVGDKIWLPADITVQRQPDGSFHILTNVPLEGSLAGKQVKLAPSLQWQTIP